MTSESKIEIIEGEHTLARADDVMPNIIHILPIASRPFFPGQGVPLLMEMGNWKSTLKAIEK